MNGFLEMVEERRRRDLERSLKADMGKTPTWSFFELITGAGRKHAGRVFVNGAETPVWEFLFVADGGAWSVTLLYPEESNAVVACMTKTVSTSVVPVEGTPYVRIRADKSGGTFMDVPLKGWELANVERTER